MSDVEGTFVSVVLGEFGAMVSVRMVEVLSVAVVPVVLVEGVGVVGQGGVASEVFSTHLNYGRAKVRGAMPATRPSGKGRSEAGTPHQSLSMQERGGEDGNENRQGPTCSGGGSALRQTVLRLCSRAVECGQRSSRGCGIGRVVWCCS